MVVLAFMTILKICFRFYLEYLAILEVFQRVQLRAKSLKRVVDLLNFFK